MRAKYSIKLTIEVTLGVVTSNVFHIIKIESIAFIGKIMVS